VNAEDITMLLDRIGCHRVRLNQSGWVNASCPFAPFTTLHKTRQDNSSSFGVHVDEGPSHYRCFTCNAKGSVTDMLTRLRVLMERAGHETSVFSELHQWVTKKDREALTSVDALRHALERADYRPTGPVEVGGVRLSAKTARAALGWTFDQPDTVLPESDLDVFEPLNGESYDYLKDRGLDEVSIERWEFRWHPQARRIAIPIRDCRQRLVGISGRSLEGESKRKFMHSLGFQRDRYLYGECRLKEGGGGTGVIVEGFFDAIHLWQHGYQGVAIMGTHLSRVQLEKLVRFFADIVILPDGDSAGLEAADRMQDILVTRIPTRVAKVPRNSDPDELGPLELAELLGPSLESAPKPVTG
jgi:DNA primase